MCSVRREGRGGEGRGGEGGRGMFSTLGDTASTSWGYHEYIGGYHEYIGGIS